MANVIKREILDTIELEGTESFDIISLMCGCKIRVSVDWDSDGLIVEQLSGKVKFIEL